MSGTTFRGLRRADRGIPLESAEEILHKGDIGFLGVIGDNGYPYVVPLNYYYDAGRKRIYFHCAAQGHKLDAIKADDKVCFSVVTTAEVLVDDLSIQFDSVVVFGRAETVTGDEKEHGIQGLLDKYIHEKGTITRDEVAQYVQKHIENTSIVKIEAEHICGKNRLD